MLGHCGLYEHLLGRVRLLHILIALKRAVVGEEHRLGRNVWSDDVRIVDDDVLGLAWSGLVHNHRLSLEKQQSMMRESNGRKARKERTV